MSKHEFLHKLKNALRWAFSEEEVADILSDYEGFFTADNNEGKSEQEICAALGSPAAIAGDLREAMGKKAVRPLSARIVKRLALSGALFIAAYLLAAYESTDTIADNIFIFAGFSAALWLALRPALKTSRAAAPRKWPLPAGHILLALSALACFTMVKILNAQLAHRYVALDPAHYGPIAAMTMLIFGGIALLIGVFALYGFYRYSPYYMTLALHAVGVVCYLSAFYHILRELNEPSHFYFMTTLLIVVYGAAAGLSGLSALFIRAALRRGVN